MIDSLLKNADPVVAAALDHALSGKDISVDEAIALFDSTGLEMNLAVMVADELRRRTVATTSPTWSTGTSTLPTSASSSAAFVLSAGTFAKRKATFCRPKRS